MRGPAELLFATSNEHKFQEARVALKDFGFRLRRLPGKGREIQSEDVGEIAREAALNRFREVGKPLFVEDTGLFVRALNGFPGPYAAFVNGTLGPRSLLVLLGHTSGREAEFVSAAAYCWGPGAVKVFRGRLLGSISRRARGTNGFGFDPVFVPLHGEKTLAELSMREKAKVSHRSRALKAMGSWLSSNRAGNVYLHNAKESAG